MNNIKNEGRQKRKLTFNLLLIFYDIKHLSPHEQVRLLRLRLMTIPSPLLHIFIQNMGT